MYESDYPEDQKPQDNNPYNNPYVHNSVYTPPVAQRTAQSASYPVTQTPASAIPVMQKPPAPAKPSGYWIFNRFQRIFAVVSLLMAYLLKSCVFTLGGVGVFALVFFETSLVCSLIYLLKIGSKLRASNIIWFSLLAIYPVSFIIIDNPAVKALGALILIVAIMLFIYTTASGIKCFRETFLYDYVSTVFVAPFKYFPTLPVALFKPSQDSKGKRVLRYVLIGLLIAIPLTAILLGILMASDEAFRSFIGENLLRDILETVKDIFLAIPFAFLIFSFFTFAYRDRNRIAMMKAQPITKLSKGNSIIFITLYIPVIILYLVFFFSQFAYFTDVFKNILPQELTYSEYAVHGFFEMCLVVAINLALVILTLALCKKNERGSVPLILKLEMTLFSLFSLVFATIAVAKMVMYTNAYGLTHRRVYALWIIATLVLMVLISALKTLCPRLSFFKASIVALTVIIFSVSFTNVDAIIAKYNVKWYKEGKIGWMGEEALYELDKSSVPYLVELLDDKNMETDSIYSGYQFYYYDDEYRYWADDDFADSYYDDYLFESRQAVGDQVEEYFSYLRSYSYDCDGFNISAYRAEKLFEEYGIEAYQE